MGVRIVFDGWIYVCVDADAKNRPIGNLPQWDDFLSDSKAAFRSWFIVDDGRNELQKSGGSDFRKQVVRLSSRSISAGNLVFFVLTKGMSVVGPRPALPNEVAAYNDYQRQGLLVKPGMTCYWQTRRNRDSITFDEWVDLDL